MFNDLRYSLWSTDNLKETDSKYIGEKIGTGTAQGYDLYENIMHYQDVEIYSIKKVDSNAAVCVKFVDENVYYSMCNNDYNFETIGDFIDALNLKEYAKLTPLHYTYFDKNDNDYDVNFDVPTAEVLNTFFSERSSAISMSNGYIYNENWYTISFSVEAIGRTNLALTCYFDGTIVTNLFAYGRKFNVSNAVNEYFDYVNSNYDGYVIKYIYSEPKEE